MAEGGIRTMYASIILVGLFIFCMIAGASYFAFYNDLNTTVTQDPIISKTYSDINSSLGDLDSTGEARTGLRQDVPSGAEEISLKSMIAALFMIDNIIFGFFSILFGVFSRLGIHPIVFVSIFSIITISLVIWIWRAWKVGE